MSKFGILLFAALVLTGLTAPNRALAEDSCDPGVSESVLIKASPEAVWTAMRDLRAGEQFHRKVLSASHNSLTVEETFGGLPVIGCTTCVINENEVPGKSVEFELVHSDHLKRFGGTWTLRPSQDGKQTWVKLTTYCELGMHVPFARNMTYKSITRNMDLQLAVVKELAESKQKIAMVER